MCDPDEDDVVERRVPTHAFDHKLYRRLLILDAGIMWVKFFFVGFRRLLGISRGCRICEILSCLLKIPRLSGQLRILWLCGCIFFR